MTVMLRPEQMGVTARDRAPDSAVTATVLHQDFYGHDAMITLGLTDGTRVTARILDAGKPLALGDDVAVHVRGVVRAWPRTVGSS
ncbi:hypothetical protein FDG2_2123 [Candidatus Protofrankia californiensis]|uniref:Transport-associated OB type 2 domain-containing protein n=1 Tax=Candidatus Protofrankia californiensis TaxID=1839754 RepID=A0A1C3NX07_9ACTN|nr:hypothetical protein FDG2_2123 [Candidatus Protofrankia californiensis]